MLAGLLAAVLACVLAQPVLAIATQPAWYKPSHKSQILWDSYGVAHVKAATVNDLFYGFGWAQAKSHGNLLLKLYAQARGNAAEVYGPAELQNDRWMAINEVSDRSIAWLAAQPADFRGQLEAFAAGINAYARAHPDALSQQARRVLPVSALDVVAHEQRLFQFIYAAPASIVERLPQDAELPEQEAQGSNGWAIAPTRTTTGHAMILMNPHLPWPSGWSTYYEVHLRAPGIDLYGATQVGLPVLRFVFSPYLAFTHTVNAPSAVTFYRIKQAPGGYLYDGQVLPFKVSTRVLHIRADNGDVTTETVTVRTTVQGPIVAEKDGAPIAMRVAGLDRPLALSQYWREDIAHNLAQFQAAFDPLQVPSFNVIYADRDGHIEYLYNALIPRHSFGDLKFWSSTVPGDTSATMWHDYLSYEELPKIIDPKGGTVQNSNDPPWDAAWPEVLDAQPYAAWIAKAEPNLRMERGIRMLGADAKISFEQLIEDKWSTRSELADRILPDLLAAVDASGDDLARQAAEVLRHWDRCTNAESRGALLFLAWAREKGTPRGYVDTDFLHPFDITQPLSTPNGLRDPDAAVLALHAAAQKMLEQTGALDTPWGQVMRFQSGQVNLPASGGPGTLGVFNVIDYAALKDGQRAANFGASYVALVSFEKPLRAKVLLSYGTSSQPGSPHASDQLPLLSRGQLRDAWRTDAQIRQHLESVDHF